jgi:hypothetical protein
MTDHKYYDFGKLPDAIFLLVKKHAQKTLIAYQTENGRWEYLRGSREKCLISDDEFTAVDGLRDWIHHKQSLDKKEPHND